MDTYGPRAKTDLLLWLGASVFAVSLKGPPIESLCTTNNGHQGPILTPDSYVTSTDVTSYKLKVILSDIETKNNFILINCDTLHDTVHGDL